MDLKDFIKETVSSIAVATDELQDELLPRGVIVNPPVGQREGEIKAIDVESTFTTLRPLVEVSFDVAVTVGSETSGEGKAGLKIASFEVGGKGGHSKASEQVSRVQFKIPLALSPSDLEKKNLDLAERERAASDRAMADYTPPSIV